MNLSMNLQEYINSDLLAFSFPVRCTLFQFPSTLLCSHSWSLWVVCGISQKFSHSAEPLEPQAPTKWAGGLPKLGLVGRLPVLPDSNWAGKQQNSFFHSISFSFWCWLHPKRQRQWKGKEEGISCIFSVLSKGSVGPQAGVQCGARGKGMIPTHLGHLWKLGGILFRASEKNSLVSLLPWKSNIETGCGFF